VSGSRGACQVSTGLLFPPALLSSGSLARVSSHGGVREPHKWEQNGPTQTWNSHRITFTVCTSHTQSKHKGTGKRLHVLTGRGTKPHLKGSVLVHLGSCDKITTDRRDCRHRHLSLTVLGARHPRSTGCQIWCPVSPVCLVHRWSSCWVGREGPQWGLFHKGTDPILEAPFP